MTAPNEVVFLIDVDNTLLNSDRVPDDLRDFVDCDLPALLGGA